MSRNQRFYEYGKAEARKRDASLYIVRCDPYTVCIVQSSITTLVGVSKRNPIDPPNQDLGDAIAVRRALINFGKWFTKTNEISAMVNSLSKASPVAAMFGGGEAFQ